MIEGLDPVIHPPKRLAAMAVLAHADYAEFKFLRGQLQLSDSDLSKQMSALVEAGYVQVDKQGRGRGSVTTYRVTRVGAKAYRAYRAALEELLTGAGLPDRPNGRAESEQ